MRVLSSFVRCLALACSALFVGGSSAKAVPEHQILSPDDVIMVSTRAYESEDPSDIIDANFAVVMMLTEEHLKPSEISRAALTSYYVDDYLTQMNNGGFSQFVYNSQWDDRVVGFVRQGLSEMGALRHLALFEEGAASVKALSKEELNAYLNSRYFDDPASLKRLSGIEIRFFALDKTENLIALNAAWLRRQPTLKVLSTEELEKEVARRSEAIPDRAKRIEAAERARPRNLKLIDALCKKSGQTLESVGPGYLTHFYDGKVIREIGEEELEKIPPKQRQMTWLFMTDKGMHLMTERNGKSLTHNP